MKFLTLTGGQVGRQLVLVSTSQCVSPHSSLNSISNQNLSFPEPIPADTAVPGWAYENVTTEGQFDINQALADHCMFSQNCILKVLTFSLAPESTATGLPKTASAPGGSPTSPATPSSSSGKKSDTGAIAGGVVGGVVGVAILAGLGFFLIRKYAGKPKSGNNGVVENYAGSEKTGQGGSSTLHPLLA